MLDIKNTQHPPACKRDFDGQVSFLSSCGSGNIVVRKLNALYLRQDFSGIDYECQ